MAITATAIPQQSEIAQRLPGADFHDCYTMDTQPNQLSALETYLKVAATTPRWVNLAMALRVELSVCKTPQQIAISTVVHINNALGRVYMLFVAPAHRRIVPATMRTASFL